jgi:hypothetical protein
MVHNISGLLISLKQNPVTELIEAYQVCRAEALKNNAGWVPVDYPQNSDSKKTSMIVLVLYEHPLEEKIDVEKSNRTKLARTAKEWLKARGMSGTKKIKFVTTEPRVIQVCVWV